MNRHIECQLGASKRQKKKELFGQTGKKKDRGEFLYWNADLGLVTTCLWLPE